MKAIPFYLIFVSKNTNIPQIWVFSWVEVSMKIEEENCTEEEWQGEPLKPFLDYKGNDRNVISFL